MTDTDRPVVGFDHHSPEYRERSAEMYAELRAKCPVAWSDRYDGFWVPTTYRDISIVAKNDAAFSSDFDPDGERNGYGGINIPRSVVARNFPMECDPPEYNVYRRMMNPFFSPGVAADMEPFVRDCVTAFIDRSIEKGSWDFILDFANPVPAIMTMRLIGLPLDDWEKFATPMHEIVAGGPGSEMVERARRGLVWIAEQIKEAVDERRAHPTDDLISTFAHTRVDGELLSRELLAQIFHVIIGGGTDTVTNLFAHSVWWLAQHPDVRQQLRTGDDALLASACEEFLRYFSPLQTNARTVATDVDLGGQHLHQGDRILVPWVAANRDPQEFDNPDTVDVGRFPNRHAAFGIGIHRCIGSNLARMEIKIMLREILNRIPDYHIDNDAVQKYPTVGYITGFINMPATFTPGPKLGSTITL